MTAELDRKVAEAMGWNPRIISLYDSGGRPLPRLMAYSADYAALPKLLAWLTAQGALTIEHDPRDQDQAGKRVWVNLFPLPPGKVVRSSVSARGATLPEALCNLAVAAREAGK